MNLSDFDYHLPTDRIAQTPAEPRDSARLLMLDKNSGALQDTVFHDIVDELGANDVLVVNATHVIKARLRGRISPFEKGSTSQNEGRDCEIFLHKKISEDTWDCLVYPGKKLKVGTRVIFSHSKPHLNSSPQGEEEVTASLSYKEENLSEGVSPVDKSELLSATIKDTSEKGRIVEFSEKGQKFLDIIDMIGETPLPPYIKNSDAPAERYQTVYNEADKAGSVAAPTAGLHFTPELLVQLKKRGVKIEKVLLHVGLGTFANVEVEDIENHHMHSEYAEIDSDVSKRLNTYKSEGKRIIAVGTTSVRTLESFSSATGQLGKGSIDTEIFIYPGYRWKFVDSIITNFHLPKSTLLMLVSSFAGSENIKKAYEHAVDSEYRFFSFGDAMWLK